MHTVNRDELLKQLQTIEPGRSKNPQVEQSDCFVFDEGSVMTFNAEIFCRAMGTGLPDDFKAAVNGSRLLEVLDKLTEEEIQIGLRGGSFVIRSGSRTEVKLRTQAKITLPLDEVAPPQKWNKLPESFGDAVAHVCKIPSGDQFITSSVNLTPDHIEGTNRIQVVRHAFKTGLENTFLVRAKSLAHVAKLGLIRVGETEQWVHFRSKSLIFSCRRHVCPEYPELGQYFDFEGTEIEFPRGAEPAAAIGNIFGKEDKDDPSVDVVIEDGKMTIEGCGSQGEARVVLDTEHKGPRREFRMHAGMLEHIVKQYQRCEFGDGRLRVVGDNWWFFSCLPAPKRERQTEE